MRQKPAHIKESQIFKKFKMFIGGKRASGLRMITIKTLVQSRFKDISIASKIFLSAAPLAEI
jgi:hypothetical protein